MAWNEKSLEILLIVIGILLIGAAMAALAGKAPMISIPGTDFFSFIGRTLNFLGEQVGLAGKGTADWFCDKGFQENEELCKMTTSHLADYCKMPDEEKTGVCAKPPDAMKRFCTLSWSDREAICKKQNEFNSACDSVNTWEGAHVMANMPFCK